MNPANAWLLLTTRSPGVNFIPGGWGTVKPADVAAALGGLKRSRFLMGMGALAGDRSVLEDLVTYVNHELVMPAAEAGGWKIRRGSEAYRRLAALAVFELMNGDRCFVCNGVGEYAPPPVPKRRSVEAAIAEADLPPAPNQVSLRKLIRRHQRLRQLASVIVQEFQPTETTSKDKERLKQLLKWVEDLAQRTAIDPKPGTCELCAGSGRIRFEGKHRAWLTGFSQDHWYRIWAARYSPVQCELQGWISDCLTHVRARFARGPGSSAEQAA